MYLSKKQNQQEIKLLDEVEKIFSYLDGEGIIHLRLSQLFFLSGAILICENYTIPLHFDSFKIHFKQIIGDMCEI